MGFLARFCPEPIGQNGNNQVNLPSESWTGPEGRFDRVLDALASLGCAELHDGPARTHALATSSPSTGRWLRRDAPARHQARPRPPKTGARIIHVFGTQRRVPG